MRLYSIVIPVYNRPDEVGELLESLTKQRYQAFEVLIIEDGSSVTCKSVADQYASVLDIKYHFKENGGQGFARNFGFEKAKGEYLIVFDSDCLIPEDYLQIVDSFLNEHQVDAFGGPDRAHPGFNTLQKAISYSMTSPLTTGGIRGGKRHIGKFHPRSFNMGISQEVFRKTGGYRITRMGEDVEFSIRVLDEGFTTALIEDAYVYHKRRTSLKQFYKQLHFFGRARVNVNRFFPGQMKLVHLLPFFFTLGIFTWLSTYFWQHDLFRLGVIVLSSYFFLIFIHSLLKTRSFKVGLLSIVTSFIQLYAYGMGILSEVLFPRGNQFFAQK
jgi:glycosyltransferase involved in cell wall biosynthesis